MRNFNYIIYAVAFFIPFAVKSQQNSSNGTVQTSNHHDLNTVPMVHWKFYGGVGGTLYGGELTGKQLTGSNSAFKGTRGRPSATMGVAYKVADHFFLKTEVSYCFIKGSETKQTMENFGRYQTFQFRSDNFDLVVMGQFNIFPYTYLKENSFIPYVVLGIGATTNSPKGYFKNHWESLEKLSNGQIKNKILPVVPAGIGFLYRMNSQWDIGLDATIRYALGGSLDGDSRKGVITTSLSEDGKQFFEQYYNPAVTTVLKDHKKYNDLYSVLQIRLQYTFIPEKFKYLFLQKDINTIY